MTTIVNIAQLPEKTYFIVTGCLEGGTAFRTENGELVELSEAEASALGGIAHGDPPRFNKARTACRGTTVMNRTIRTPSGELP
jgi:hypothetical protein